MMFTSATGLPMAHQSEVGVEGMTNTTDWAEYEAANHTLPEYVNAFEIVYVRWIFIVLYVIVFACCFLGNVFVILVVLRHRKMRTITNFFLANLAGADLCVGIFCVLPNLSTQLAPVWKLGKVMCKLYYFVQAMSYAASIMILTVISIERYFAIIHPMRSKQFTTLCLLRVVVVIVWTVAAGCAVPYLVIYDTVNLQGMEFCLMIGHFDNKSYVTISFILWYLIPLCLMTIMYTKISVVLWKTSNIENLEKNNSFKQKKSSNKKRRKSPGDLKHALFGRKKADHKNSMLSKTTIYISGVSTPGSSDETTQEESRVSYVQNPVTETYDQRLLQSPPGCRSTEISGEEGEVEEHSSDEATDFEDDWPGSQKNNRKQGHHINMKQVYTFRNPTYNGACPVCGASTSKDTRGSPMEKCGCSNSRTPLTPPAGTRGPSSDAPCTVQTRKPTRRNENALLARRRVIRLLIAVIVSFAICVIPYHIRLLWVTWSEPSLSFAESLLPPITFVIFYFNSGLNPILYAFLSDNFRRSLREVLSCSVDESSRLRNMRSTTYVKTMNSSM